MNSRNSSSVSNSGASSNKKMKLFVQSPSENGGFFLCVIPHMKKVSDLAMEICKIHANLYPNTPELKKPLTLQNILPEAVRLRTSSTNNSSHFVDISPHLIVEDAFGNNDVVYVRENITKSSPLLIMEKETNSNMITEKQSDAAMDVVEKKASTSNGGAVTRKRKQSMDVSAAVSNKNESKKPVKKTKVDQTNNDLVVAAVAPVAAKKKTKAMTDPKQAAVTAVQQKTTAVSNSPVTKKVKTNEMKKNVAVKAPLPSKKISASASASTPVTNKEKTSEMKKTTAAKSAKKRAAPSTLPLETKKKDPVAKAKSDKPVGKTISPPLPPPLPPLPPLPPTTLPLLTVPSKEEFAANRKVDGDNSTIVTAPESGNILNESRSDAGSSSKNMEGKAEVKDAQSNAKTEMGKTPSSKHVVTPSKTPSRSSSRTSSIRSEIMERVKAKNAHVDTPSTSFVDSKETKTGETKKKSIKNLIKQQTESAVKLATSTPLKKCKCRTKKCETCNLCKKHSCNCNESMTKEESSIILAKKKSTPAISKQEKKVNTPKPKNALSVPVISAKDVEASQENKNKTSKSAILKNSPLTSSKKLAESKRSSDESEPSDNETFFDSLKTQLNASTKKKSKTSKKLPSKTPTKTNGSDSSESDSISLDGKSLLDSLRKGNNAKCANAIKKSDIHSETKSSDKPVSRKLTLKTTKKSLGDAEDISPDSFANDNVVKKSIKSKEIVKGDSSTVKSETSKKVPKKPESNNSSSSDSDSDDSDGENFLNSLRKAKKNTSVTKKHSSSGSTTSSNEDVTTSASKTPNMSKSKEKDSSESSSSSDSDSDSDSESLDLSQDILKDLSKGTASSKSPASYLPKTPVNNKTPAKKPKLKLKSLVKSSNKKAVGGTTPFSSKSSRNRVSLGSIKLPASSGKRSGNIFKTPTAKK